MIEALTSPGALPDRPPLSIRIGSFLDAYGTAFPFARFWRTDGDGFLSVVDGAATVLVGQSDVEEIRLFLSMLGVSSVMSDAPLFDDRQRSLSVFCRIVEPVSMPFQDPDYESAYRVLSQAFSMPPFDVWYADVCHRVRHGTAVVSVAPWAAFFAARHADALLLTGIAVDTDHRRQGLASRLLESAYRCGVTSVYAIAEDDCAASFYHRNGFTVQGQIYYYEEG